METEQIYKLKKELEGMISKRSEAFEEMMKEIINKEMDYSTTVILTKVYKDANEMPLKIIDELIKNKLEKNGKENINQTTEKTIE